MDKFEDLKIALFGGEKTGLIDFSQPSLLCEIDLAYDISPC